MNLLLALSIYFSIMPLNLAQTISLASLLVGFMKSTISSRVIVFSCPQDISTNVQLAKEIFANDLSVLLAGPPFGNTDMAKLNGMLSTEIHHIAVFLDLDCPEADYLWNIVTHIEPPNRPVGPLHHWLLISEKNNSDDILNSTSESRPAMDSHVIYATPTAQGSYSLTEIYRIGFNLPELIHFPLSLDWKPGDSFPEPAPRNDLMGAVIKIGILERGDNWTNRMVWNRKHINTVTKHGFSIIQHVLRRLNLTFEPYFRSSYGAYKKDANGFFTGILGLLQRKEVDLLSGLHLNQERLNYMDATGELFTYRPSFIFRTPVISATDNIYLLPFSKSVWISTGVMLTICTLLFLLAERGNPNNDWLETIFICLSTLCDQGAETSPDRYSSRIVFFTLLIQSVFLFNAYSACIVVLLRAPNDRIHDLKSLIDSPFRIVMEDNEINRQYRYITQDPVAMRLYRERVDKHRDREVFMSLQMGVELVRKELVAFHVDIHANKEIADTFEESEKCGLVRINIIKWQINMPLVKYSPLREIMTRNLLAVNQCGLNDREFRYWYQAFPTCYNQEASFASVTIQDFHPTLQILGIGYFLALMFFFLEMMYSKMIIEKKMKKNSNFLKGFNFKKKLNLNTKK